MKPPSPFLEVVPEPSSGEPELELVFARARELAEPSVENRRRVSSALRAALPQLSGSGVVERGLWAGQAPSGLEPTVWPERAPIARRPSFLRRAMRSPSAALLFGGALFGALGFWLGHGAGYRAGARGAGSPEAVAMPDAPAGSAPAAPARGAGQSGANGVESAVPTVPAEGATPAAPAALGPEAAASRTPGRRTRASDTPRASRAASDADRAAAAPVAPHGAVQSLSFRQVLEQLRRAQQHLRNGQATMSLLVLSELDRGAGELLREERETTRVLSLCAVGEHAAARDAAARLEQTSPRSIYGSRLAASCVSGDAASDF